MLYLGIDVSKEKLDCALLDPSTAKHKAKIVANSLSGYTTLLAWLAKLKATDVHVIMEPTGFYHEAIALELTDAEFPVTLVNARRLRRYAEGIGVRSKTDMADSVVLARYGAREKRPLWQPPSVSVRRLRTLLARHDCLKVDLNREQNCAERTILTDTPVRVHQSMQQLRAFLTRELEELEAAIKQHVVTDPALLETWKLLLTIPGVGERLASHMVALLAARKFEDAEQLAAYLGLVPVKWQSGTSVHKPSRLPKAAPKRLRALFFFPALAAIRANPDVKALYQRLRDRGMPKMAAIGAAMHKLAHLCFGVVRSGKPYDPNWRGATNKAADLH